MMTMNELIKLNEPLLLFNHNQALEDPRDGLTLFGPVKHKPPFGISYGLIGTVNGINRFYKWSENVHKFISHKEKKDLWIPFPGFESVFGIPFSPKPVREIVINEMLLQQILRNDDSFQRVHKSVNLYSKSIIEFYKKSDESLDLWFVISPEEVFKSCRPQSKILNPVKKVSRSELKNRQEKANHMKKGQTLIFSELEEDYEAYQFDNDFRKQLKANLILKNVKNPIQILRESTLAPDDFLNEKKERIRELQPESQVAWNILSTAFYKAGGKPWKLSGIREGVCYLGMVYKRLDREADPRSACCAAQMFLDSGDGVVFKGAVGPWKSQEKEEYHLSKEAARDLIDKAVQAYTDIDYFGFKEKPKEIFIHGKTHFNDEEWAGFSNAAGKDTKIVGVRIKPVPFRLFREGKYCMLRGMAYIENERKGYLWTTGYIPRLWTSPFQGIPIPLCIEICKGEADIKVVLQDIYALTKLNYNSCHYGDSEPITITFADKVGDILTAGPIKKDQAPLQFKFYI